MSHFNISLVFFLQLQFTTFLKVKLFLQFSVTEHFRTGDVGHLQSLPGVFFFYDLSPIKVVFCFSKLSVSLFSPSCFDLLIIYWTCILQVTFTEQHVSFLHFLTNVCAIVGGIYWSSPIRLQYCMIGLHKVMDLWELYNLICMNHDITMLAVCGMQVFSLFLEY